VEKRRHSRRDGMGDSRLRLAKQAQGPSSPCACGLNSSQIVRGPTRLMKLTYFVYDPPVDTSVIRMKAWQASSQQNGRTSCVSASSQPDSFSDHRGSAVIHKGSALKKVNKRSR
jgi:hypothetical protein